MVALLGLFLAISLVAPLYPKEQLLQHAPTPLALGFLLWCARRGAISDRAMLCLVCFLGLHVVGARYIYSYVPLGESLDCLALGGDLPDRNHYDRLVHLAFGFLLVIPTAEWAQRKCRLPVRSAKAFAIASLMALSCLYEIFEWLLTILVSPEHADSYNGQQGDPWDAQKDMALAWVGSLLALPLVRSARSTSPSD